MIGEHNTSCSSSIVCPCGYCSSGILYHYLFPTTNNTSCYYVPGRSMQMTNRLVCRSFKLALLFVVFVANAANEEQQCSNDNQTKNEPYDPDLECGIWLAPSTIPNTGFGMFAGKDFKEGDLLAKEMVVPLIDMDLYSAHIYNPPFFLWELYWWDGIDVLTTHEGYNQGMGIVGGFGSAPNTILALINVDEDYPDYQNSAGLHRSKDAGAGAFSEIGGRPSTAKYDLEAGDELFVNYGFWYFTNRHWYGPVPLYDDLKKAKRFFTEYLHTKARVQKNEQDNDAANADVDAVMEEAWDLFVRQDKQFSRILGAFYKNDPNELKLLEEYKGDIEELRMDQSKQSLQFLRKHGGCGDHITYGQSTLPQAGRGAFARRDLPTGTLVSPFPLIHLPRREILDTFPIEIKYDEEDGDYEYKVNRKGKKGAQLLVNYCFGHKETTMMLCPYGMNNNYVNHNQTLANVRLQWSDGTRSSHHAEYLEKPLSEFHDLREAKLAFELIATRDIKEGEEIFMDYGDEWEQHWQEHVKNWKPVPGAEDYIPAHKLNDEEEYFRTEEEQEENPYPKNVFIGLWEQFLKGRGWKKNWQETGQIECPQDIHEVEVVSRYENDEGEYEYDVKYDGRYTVKGLPQAALKFVDKPHTGDMFLENAFRHHIGIPDDMLPDAWRNVPLTDTAISETKDEL